MYPAMNSNRKFQAVGNSHFLEDAGQVMLHRLFRDGQLLRDILVCASLGNFGNDFTLTSSEAGWSWTKIDPCSFAGGAHGLDKIPDNIPSDPVFAGSY